MKKIIIDSTGDSIRALNKPYQPCRPLLPLAERRVSYGQLGGVFGDVFIFGRTCMVRL